MKPSDDLIDYEKYYSHVLESSIRSYLKSPIEHILVNLRNFKLWFLDILDIEIYYEDGTEFKIEAPENLNFNPVLEELITTDKNSEDYTDLKQCETDFKEEIASMLEQAGLGKIDINSIDYEIVEYIQPND